MVSGRRCGRRGSFEAETRTFHNGKYTRAALKLSVCGGGESGEDLGFGVRF